MTVKLDRDRIVDVALRLLDEVGLDKLSLRGLAQELGVQAPALYWHVRNKRELLDQMAVRLMTSLTDDPGPLDPARWDEWLAANARAHRRRLLAHRDGARLVAGARPIGELFAALNEILEGLHRAGFPPVEGARTLLSIGHFVTGFVLEEQAERARGDQTQQSDHEAFAALLDRGGLPFILSALTVGGDPNGEDAFEHGLAMLVDGARAVLARQSGPPAPVDGRAVLADAREIVARWEDAALPEKA